MRGFSGRAEENWAGEVVEYLGRAEIIEVGILRHGGGATGMVAQGGRGRGKETQH